jgi:hypothetical protein
MYKETFQLHGTVTHIRMPLLPLTLATINGRGRQPSQGLEKQTLTPQGLGLDTLSRPVCNPYYKHP